MSPNQNLSEITPETEEPPGASLKLAKLLALAQNAHLPLYPKFFKQTLSENLQNFYCQNGNLLLLKTLRVEVVTDINRCQLLWEEFSPKQTLFDTWDFRYAFWLGYQHIPYFLLLKNASENIALLPLWYEKEDDTYYWFGSCWQEENNFFTKDPLLIPLMLSLCPNPAHLNAISLVTSPKPNQLLDFTSDDPKFVLSLTNLRGVDDFLSKLKKKKRYNLRRDRRIIEAQNPKIIFDRFTDFDILVEICIERFKKKGEDTDWENPKRVETFRQVIELSRENKNYEVRMLTVEIGKKVAGVDLVATYNGCYYPLKCGYDVENFPGIGNFVNLVEIDDAIALGMEKMDFLEVNYGWKDKWFETVPLFKFEKGTPKRPGD